MLTFEILDREMEISRTRESGMYDELMADASRGIGTTIEDLYDQALGATRRLARIDADAIMACPEVVKILRYCTNPVISQMRLGQTVGLTSTKSFEDDGKSPARSVAETMAALFTRDLDHERFPWVRDHGIPAAEALMAGRYAKLATVRLIHSQNVTTDYRTLRRRKQEQAIADALEAAGMSHQKQMDGEGLEVIDDIAPGRYVRDKKILGSVQKRQKADLICRHKDAQRIFAIEGKAVGILVDSTKRLKEVNEKHTDWSRSGMPVTTIGVCSGHFRRNELVATIRDRGIPVFFEHRLDMLTEYVKSGFYYGTRWEEGPLRR